MHFQGSSVLAFLAALVTPIVALPHPPVVRRDDCNSTLVTLATFNSSASFLANPPQAISSLNNDLGNIEAYYGVQAEDGQTGYVVLLYSDVHQEPIPTPRLQGLLQDAALNGGDSVSVQTVLPNGDISQVLTLAPLTEVTTMNLLPGKTLEDLTPVMEQLRVMLDNVTGQYGAGHWGPVVELPTQVHDFVGWESIEEHVRLVSTPEFAAVASQIVEIVTASSGHAHFTKLV